MDLVEEAMDHDNNNNHNHSNSSNNTNSNDQFAPSAAVKGKRTKRQRPASAAAAAPASSISSAELSCSTTEEEEDMANCLILLAQGHRSDAGAATAATKKLASRRSAEKARLDVYQCKTCNKCFPSFQALGGHRTSHRKPKIAVVPLDEEKKPAADEACLQITTTCSISKPVLTSNNDNTGVSKGSNKPKAHECSICGLEFSSGQALGGHMRRHRPVAVAEPPEIKKEKNVLSLDLNLPAPPDDDCEELPKSPASAMAFSFENQQPLVFSASALVDCHY